MFGVCDSWFWGKRKDFERPRGKMVFSSLDLKFQRITVKFVPLCLPRETSSLIWKLTSKRNVWVTKCFSCRMFCHWFTELLLRGSGMKVSCFFWLHVVCFGCFWWDTWIEFWVWVLFSVKDNIWLFKVSCDFFFFFFWVMRLFPQSYFQQSRKIMSKYTKHFSCMWSI